MGETRGAATIVDRVEGWGHKASTDANREDNDTWGSALGNSVTATDSTPETTDGRADRSLKARKQGDVTADPDLAERTKGFGGEFEPTAGADNGYRTDGVDDVWDDEDEDLGASKDVEFTGSNTAFDEDADSEFLATGRTADSRDTVLLNDGNAARLAEAERTSIVDRTTGWGHTAGSLTNRND